MGVVLDERNVVWPLNADETRKPANIVVTQIIVDEAFIRVQPQIFRQGRRFGVNAIALSTCPALRIWRERERR